MLQRDVQYCSNKAILVHSIQLTKLLPPTHFPLLPHSTTISTTELTPYSVQEDKHSGTALLIVNLRLVRPTNPHTAAPIPPLHHTVSYTSLSQHIPTTHHPSHFARNCTAQQHAAHCSINKTATECSTFHRHFTSPSLHFLSTPISLCTRAYTLAIRTTPSIFPSPLPRSRARLLSPLPAPCTVSSHNSVAPVCPPFLAPIHPSHFPALSVCGRWFTSLLLKSSP